MKNLATVFCIGLFSFATFAQEFSPEWKTVPTSFMGLDIKAIHNAMLSSTRTLRDKDEFETTAAFEKRRADKSSISLGGKLTAD